MTYFYNISSDSNDFMDINHYEGKITLYQDGEEITTFGGYGKRVAIQKVNGNSEALR